MAKKAVNGKVAIVVLLLSNMIAGSHAFAGNWWENFKFKGDFRYRHELIEKKGKDGRNRQRIRARVSLEAKVSDYTRVGIRLASGSDDPVSTNQTLGDAGSTKNIGVDLAYFETTFHGANGLKLTGGKFKNPFYRPGKSELIWDSDLNPEGGALKYTVGTGTAAFVVTGSGWWLEERSGGEDSYLAAAQAMGRFSLNEEKTRLAIGGGFFNFVNSQGFEPFFDSEDALGNRTVWVQSGSDSVLNYANEFEILELFVDVTQKLGETPLAVFGDYVKNSTADSFGTGWLVGIKIGKAKKKWSWQIRYNYREVERDAVLGALTDSDFIGGGTDGKGHEFGGSLQLAENTALGVTYFVNEIGLQQTIKTDFDRLQVDLQLKF